MSSGKRAKVTYCWDTSVFLAWLGEEATAPLNDIGLVADEIDRGDANLLVPVTVYSEVLEAKNTPAQMEKFRKFLDRSNVVVADTTKVIADKAGQIRSRGIQVHPPRSIKTPDATMMATAIVYGTDVFHSLEPKHHNLDGSPIVDGLKIELPKLFGGQGSFLDAPA